MQISLREFACSAVWVVVAAAVLGCTKSETPTADSAGQPATSESSKYDVQVASAESKIVPRREPVPRADDLPTLLPAEDSNAAESNSIDTHPGARRSPASGKNGNSSGAAIIPIGERPDAELTMPTVTLTKVHAESCRVKVGDAFPDLHLSDTSGKQDSLKPHWGRKLTLVAFWNARERTSLEALADLGPMVANRFGTNGVNVIAVNAGDSPQLARELADHAHATFPVLCDADGAALAQVAHSAANSAVGVPRVYLLDARGRILWFDIEYSRSTRRDMLEAIRFCLAR